MQGIDEIIPVDVYVAGCPPRPEAVLDAIIKIQEGVVSKETIAKPKPVLLKP
ncbi:NAD(P)H-quinone oxidoreductase subunit K 1 precursor [compost metagenome]